MAIMLLMMVLMATFSSAAECADAEQQAARLEQLRKRIGGIKQELGSLRGEHDSVQDALATTERDIGSVTAELRRLEQASRQALDNIQLLQQERSDYQHELDKQRAALARELQSAYMTGKQQRVKLLLNQEDPASVSRMLAYHGYFSRARAARMQDYRASLERLATLEQQLLAQRAEAEQLRLQQQEKSALLATEQEKRRGILAQLQQQLRDKQSELSTLEQDEQRLQQLVRSLQQALAEIPQHSGDYQSLQQLKGKLQWPVAGRITRQYGARQASGKLSSRGVHIATQAGADVHAIARGRVVYADWLRGFGLLLIIDHGAGYMSLYGQNSSLYKHVGDRVGHGEVVAAAGSSGGQAQPGLYLELRKDGRPFDPGSWFAGKPQSLQVGRR
jgi:septal ring factor EnvC (AmiA/AmiB activator)